MEYLTNSTNLNNGITIERAASIYNKERDFTKQILEYLRDYRNRTVHSGAYTKQIENYMFLLKSCIDDLLYFHLWNHFGFSSMDDVVCFMNLPIDLDALKKRSKIVRSALKYRGL